MNKLKSFLEKSFPPKVRFTLLSFFLMIFFVVLYIQPATKTNHVYPPCVFHLITGWHCPGCGTLRGLSCLVHGDFIGFWNKNKLLILFIPYFTAEYILYAMKCFGIKRSKYFFSSTYIWIFFVVIVLYWILRNIPVYPFTSLAPH